MCYQVPRSYTRGREGTRASCTRRESREDEAKGGSAEDGRRPDCKSDRPTSARTVRVPSRTVRLMTPNISSIYGLGWTVRVTGRTVRPEAGPSELQVGPSDLPDACAQN